MKKYLLVFGLFSLGAVFLPSSCLFNDKSESDPPYVHTNCLFISTMTADTIKTKANIAFDSTIAEWDRPIVDSLLSWGVDSVKVVGTADFPPPEWELDYANFFVGYDFLVFSETCVSDEAPGLLGHPLPLLNLEAWGAAKDVLRWSKHPKAAINFPVMTSRIVAGAPKELRGGLAPGEQFLLASAADTMENMAVTGFMPTIPHIPIAMLTDTSLVDSLVAESVGGEVDTSLSLPTHLTSACAVEKGVLLADDSTYTQNRAVTIGIFAGAYNFLTPEAGKLMRAGLEWILKK